MRKPELPVIRVLIADDHRLLRAGVRATLESISAGVQFIIEEAESTEDAMRVAFHAVPLPDIILMDYKLPGRGGPTATRLIRERKPIIKILGISSYDERSAVEEMRKAGASGYVLKNIGPDTLVTAIKTVLAGGIYYSNEIALKLIDHSQQVPAPPDKSLTRREREILEMIMLGKTNRQIASAIHRSVKTVGKHRENIGRKLGTHTAVDLVRAAHKMGIGKS
ncbi:MAG: response regulator transcription factor [Puia sp.]|nr:response regulator transcription factor [Puia sp.]